MKSLNDKLLREFIRRTLKEDFSDYGVSPWVGPYGIGKGASKHSSVSVGTYGGSLYGIFIKPFVDAAKVVGSELGQTGVRLVGLLRTTIETALQALLPKFKADYDKIQADQQKYIDKLKEKYASAYEAVNSAWEHEDIQLFAFMHDPTTWLSYKMITAKPEAALSVYEMLADGNAILLNYLRDIRNRLYGAHAPGASIPMTQSRASHPVATEGRLGRKLVEADKVTKKVDFSGLEIHIDRPVGFVQKGTNDKGEKWEREYLFDYGFLKGTEGGDGEDIDVFVGPDESATEAYVITQKKADGEFDEFKVFVGFSSEDDAVEAFEAHIPKEYFDSVSSIPVGMLKGMLGDEPDVELKAEAAVKPAKKKKQPTPAEQVAAALTDPKFTKMIKSIPLVKQMQKDAAVGTQKTAADLARAMSPVLNADSAEDLARASGGAWRVPQEYASLDPEEKAKLDDVLVKQTKASMAAYYSSQLNQLVEQLLAAGVSEQSPYVTSLRSTLQKLQPMMAAGGKVHGATQ